MQKCVKIILEFDEIQCRRDGALRGRERGLQVLLALRRGAELRLGGRARGLLLLPTHHSFRGSFSAGSTPIFASKYALCSIFFKIYKKIIFSQANLQNVCKISQNFEIENLKLKSGRI